MGHTYLAVRPGVEGFEKKVVLKTLPNHLADEEELVQSLISEAKIAVMMEHKNIVSIYDLIQEHGKYFMVMEYVDGMNFSTLLEQSKSVDPGIVLYVCMQTLLALEHAHQVVDSQGRPLDMIHRDISPDNILLSKHGEVKLADFGLARIRTQIQKTQPGTLKGKFSYMSPEQAQGLPLDYRTDLFSLGLVLYEGLTGSSPYQRANFIETLHLATQAKVPAIRTYLPEIHPTLESIVHRSLEKDPEKRFQSAQEFHDALESFILPTSSERLRRSTRDFLQNQCSKSTRAEELPSVTKNSVIISAQHKSLVYVLSQDSVFSDSLLDSLEKSLSHSKNYDFRILQGKQDVEQAMDRLLKHQEVPSAVLFGGLHVAMQHPFLEALQEYPETSKLLLMDHLNGEILAIASNFCGLQAYLSAPFSMDEIVEKIAHNHHSRTYRYLSSLQQNLVSVTESEKQLRSQIGALAEANIRAASLLGEVEQKNRIIEEKNQFLERISRKVLPSSNNKATSSSFLQGDLKELNILDLFQMLALSSKSVLLNLWREDASAAVTFEKGQLVDARMGHLSGEIVVASLLHWQDGNFAVQPAQGPIKHTIQCSTEQLLLDLLRKLDEDHRSCFSLEIALSQEDIF